MLPMRLAYFFTRARMFFVSSASVSPLMTWLSSTPFGTMKRPYSSLAEFFWLRSSQIATSTRFGYSDFAGSQLKKACADSL